MDNIEITFPVITVNEMNEIVDGVYPAVTYDLVAMGTEIKLSYKLNDKYLGVLVEQILDMAVNEDILRLRQALLAVGVLAEDINNKTYLLTKANFVGNFVNIYLSSYQIQQVTRTTIVK